MFRSLSIAAVVATTAITAQANDRFSSPYVPMAPESHITAPVPYIPMTAQAVKRMQELHILRARLKAETISRMICNYTSGPVTAAQPEASEWVTPYLLVALKTDNPGC